MTDLLQQNSTRVIPDSHESLERYFIYLRHLYAYESALSDIDIHPSEIIEIGFGEGYGSKAMSRQNHNVSAIDLDKNAFLHANQKYSSENCKFYHYDGITIPFKDNSFDFAISFQVIEHVPDVKSYLQEIKRVLKPNGKSFITTPNRIYRLYPNQKPWNKFHLREYYPKQLQLEIKSVFEKVEIKGIGATGYIYTSETERAHKIREIHRKDPYKIRRLIPHRLKALFRKVIGKENSNSKLKAELRKSDKELYTTNDFFILTPQQVDNSLDLFAIASK